VVEGAAEGVADVVVGGKSSGNNLNKSTARERRTGAKQGGGAFGASSGNCIRKSRARGVFLEDEVLLIAFFGDKLPDVVWSENRTRLWGRLSIELGS